MAWEAGSGGHGRAARNRPAGSIRHLDVRQALNQVLVELDAGTYVAPDRTTTLASYVEATWLPMLATRRRKPSTIESYKRNLRLHILPCHRDG
jgi:hypothetical protein